MANQTDCAWCLTPEELRQQGPTDSHGICEEHSGQLLVNWYQNKFDAVPSYVERFKDEREAWEAEA